MGALSDAASVRRPHGPECGVPRLRRTMPDELRDEFDALLANPNVESSRLAVELTARGYTISQGVLRWHRNGNCACDRR